jgi:titin
MPSILKIKTLILCFYNFPEGSDATPVAAKDIGPPKFVSHFSQSNSVSEGQSCHLEARLTPVEDPNLKVEWFKDGKPLPTGHRFRTFHDFGIVILDILYCYAEDSGSYECKATNKLGSDAITCKVSCTAGSGLILTPQVPGEMKQHTMERIQHLESMKMQSSSETTMTTQVAPRFTVPIENMSDLKVIVSS